MCAGKCCKYFKRYLSNEEVDIFTNLFSNGTYGDIGQNCLKCVSFFMRLLLKCQSILNLDIAKRKQKKLWNILKQCSNKK
ncbi:aminoglycoside 6-adenylyltransferase [Clostridium sp. N37]|uniref:Aminoglycoside 6-adenylyltransferase n=1 Tax=Clostridium faecium TaxID=2762223 RepID=A0ABR8YSB7_9CLOT|nr:aminoglycoside 6-adenylyltransferase [Clostridium faecium]